MKRIKQVNGYAIYQAATQRDADNHNCQVGNYNIYIAQDIRDFGLSNCYPEYENLDTLTEALNICNASQYAIACALADELSSSTVQDMDLCLEIERRLDAGDSVEGIRDCYDPETGRLYGSVSEAIAAGYEPFMDELSTLDSDPYGVLNDSAEGFDPDGLLDEDDLDGDLEDVLDAAMEADEEAALRDWELSAVEVGDFMIDDDQAWKVTSKDHSTGEWRFMVESPAGESYCIDAEAAGHCRFIGKGADWSDKRHVAELWSGHEITSHATYYVVESDGDHYTKTVDISINWYESSEARLNRHRYAFLRTVAERYAFNDCCDDRVLEVVFDGCHIEYAGWQRGMLFEFREAGTGLVVFSESFPEWDH